MNCFRHPAEEAAAFCKGCDKGLCLECCRKVFANETHVCSEECAQIASQRPGVEQKEKPERLFDKIYATVFIIVLVALLSGGASFWMISHSIFSEELSAQRDARDRRTHVIGTRYYAVKVYYALGITNWKPQFGIGAAIGAVCAVIYLRSPNSKAGKLLHGLTFRISDE
jgi:hypothetical protein